MTSLGQFWITRDQFDFGPTEIELGHGTSGRVLRATDRRNGNPVAVKIMFDSLTEQEEQKKFIREFGILATNSHPGTLRLLGFCLEPTPIIVTDIMTGGTLASALKRRLPAFDATKRSICAFGIAAAMAYLHAHQILHRDLKPENVFLNDRLEPIIADFGISRRGFSNVQMTLNCGTPLFMAPEILAEVANYGTEVDVYSYAVLLYSLFDEPKMLDDGPGDTPKAIGGLPSLILRIGRGARFVRPANVPEAYWSLIRSAWDMGKENRPSFQEIVNGFRDQHLYLLPGADRRQVLEYEQRITGGETAADVEMRSILFQPDPLARSYAPRSSTALGTSMLRRSSTGSAKKKKPMDYDWS